MTESWISENLLGAVWREREKNPKAKAADIARHLGKSREAIRQALVKLGLPTKFVVVKVCEICGKKLSWGARADRCRDCFVDPKIKDAIVRDYLRGDTPAAIQLEHNIDPGGMYRILHKRNVKMRR